MMHAISLLFHDIYDVNPRESGFASYAADRYKLPVSDFDAQIEGIRGTRTDRPRLASDPTPSEDHLPFLITVDDGGVSYYTLVADRLEALGWRGHCFVSTDTIGTDGFLSPAHIRELDARGHVIGSHSASHPLRFSACSPIRMREEWSKSKRILEDLLGHEVMAASVPGGYYSAAVAHAADDAGLRMLFTSEPIVAIREERGCTVIGRFTIRRGDRSDMARRLVAVAPWTRWAAWVRWNAKGIVKPLLGPAYRHVTDAVLCGPDRLRRFLDSHVGVSATPAPMIASREPRDGADRGGHA
jgi:peptidoglycan/xylan/chitin deacetylase (PgdA/CDA1 family)